MDVSDRFADGTTAETTLHSGDVVPLFPGTLDDQPYTPDKAVTVDLDFGRGEGYDLWIYPQRNEAFAGQEPWREPRTNPLVLPDRTVSDYGLVTTAPGALHASDHTGRRHLEYDLASGGTRTISWVAGQSQVTVTDRLPDGSVESEVVPTGRQFSAG